MKTSTCHAIGVGLACLLGVTAPAAANAGPLVRAATAPVHSDWQYPETLEVLPTPQRFWLDIDVHVTELPTEPDAADLSSETATPPSSGIGGAIGPFNLSASGNSGQFLLEPPAPFTTPASDNAMVVATIEPVSEAGTLFDPISQWLPQLISDWTGGTSVAVTPWAIVAGCGLILILIARLLRLRRSEPVKTPSRKAAPAAMVQGQARAAAAQVARKLAAVGTAGGEPQEELEDWIVESMKSDDSHASAEVVSRDKLEERRQLESWRKLSQVHSKAFILKEEEDAAKQYAMWLSLVAVAFGVSGLGIVATSCLGPYSLLSGACLSATSLVIFGWSGVKVVFHGLRRWILLRPAR